MSGTSVDRAIELGTKYFKLEDYENAKNVFIKTIKLVNICSDEDVIKLRKSLGLTAHVFVKVGDKNEKRVVHPRYIKLLDNLSASWEKLNEVAKALRVADKMIEKESYNLKGYIRRGILLQKSGKNEQAYKNYKIALMMASYGHDTLKIEYSQKFMNFVQNKKEAIKQNLIKSKKDKEKAIAKDSQIKRVVIDPIEEQRSIKRQKVFITNDLESRDCNIDFIADIPVEIIPLILKDFTAAELLKLTTVSKMWYKRILSWTMLFQIFDLRRLTSREFSQFINFLKKITASKSIKMNSSDNYFNSQVASHSMKSIAISSRLPSEEKKIMKLVLTSLQNCKSDRLVLSTSQSTIHELSKHIEPNSTFYSNVRDLSLIAMLRADKPAEVKFLSNFQSLENLEIIINSSLVPLTSSFNPETSFPGSDISKLSSSWSDNLRSIRIICDQAKVKGFPLKSFLESGSSLNWSSLTRLCISGVTLDDTVKDFNWIKKFSKVEDLWLENNKNAKFETFMEIMKRNHIFQNLKSLTFREDINNGRYDLVTADNNPYLYSNFRHLKRLDLMNTCISGSGLNILTQYISQDDFEKLNIGFCPYIGFSKRYHPNDLNNINPDMGFFYRMTSLQQLILPQMGSITDGSVSALMEQIKCLNSLKKVDLSLNQSITGSSVYDLVLSIIKNNRNKPLNTLIINGCISISHVTVNTMRDKRMVTNLECIYEKETWEQFGRNSFKYRL
ncbi:hypothetical protein C6P45_004757 [Maudiozyma exigua]|uniref:F-box domain-containing protein n=1 Tax=Maudiozyma exigua TaxID=34358 RepID=A0A9P7BDG0_MAUEX|nr:hypothetical protein C6P45_004757 [Kazachstania exigua]